MTPAQQTPDIAGLPPGAVLKPIADSPAPDSQIQGLPPGAVLKPIGAENQPPPDIQAVRTANENRPWWKKALGLPSDEPAARKIDTAGNADAVQATKQSLHEQADSFKGAAKSAAQNVTMVSKGINKIPVVGEKIVPSEGLHALDEATTPHGDYEEGGATIENIMEFMAGDEALKTLSAASKLKEVHAIAQMLEKYPRLSKLVGAGLRSGAMGTEQGVKKGTENPIQEGAITGALSAGIEGTGDLGASLISKVAPKTAVVAGESTPVMAGQLKDAAPIAKTVAAEPSPEIAEAQQASAQKGVKNVASDAANKVIEKTVPPEPKYAYRVRDVGEEGVPVRNGHAQATMSEQEAQGYVDGRQTMRGGVPQEVVKVDLNKLDPADYSIKEGPSGNDWVKFNKDLPESAMGETVPAPKSEPVKAASFGDAAEQIKAAVQPTFKKLDTLSDGEFSAFQNKLKNATAAERRATSMQDMEAAQQAKTDAQQGIDDLIKKHSSQFQPDELANAQAAWKDMKVLDKVHGYVEKAFSAPEDVASKSNLVKRTLDGNKLISNLNQMVDKIPAEDLQRVLGDDGVQNLYELGQITSKAENAAKMGNIVDQVSSKLFKSGMGATAGHAVAGPAGAAVGAGADVLKDMVIRQIATKPRVADLTIRALKAGTPAKVYGPLIANEIAKGEQNQQQ
jgi:hypothetical protein